MYDPQRFRRIAAGPHTAPSGSMTSVDNLWYLADEAEQMAEQTYHRLADRATMEFETTKRVSRRRFRTVANRIRDNGAPYGAHTVVYRPSGALLLVRHEAIDMWVLPGGEADGEEPFRAAAERELREEAGVRADYDGLGMLGRVDFRCDDHATWGVLPIFAASATETDLTAADPDGEISDARWFEELPADTRDRETLLEFRERHLTG